MVLACHAVLTSKIKGHHFVKRGKFMKFKQKSLGSHDVRQRGNPLSV